MLIGSDVSVFIKECIHGVFRSLVDKKLELPGISIASRLKPHLSALNDRCKSPY